MQIVSLVVLVTGLSTALERIVELLVKPIVQLTVSERWQGVVLKSISAIISLGATWGFNLDVFTPVFESCGIYPNWAYIGLVITGLIVGLGSNIVHEVLSWMTTDVGRNGASVLTSGIDKVL